MSPLDIHKAMWNAISEKVESGELTLVDHSQLLREQVAVINNAGEFHESDVTAGVVLRHSLSVLVRKAVERCPSLEPKLRELFQQFRS
jgi:hypothetical protein